MSDDRIELFDDNEDVISLEEETKEDFISLEEGTQEDVIVLEDNNDQDFIVLSEGEEGSASSPGSVIEEENLDESLIDLFTREGGLDDVEVIELIDDDTYYEEELEEDSKLQRLGLEEPTEEVLMGFLQKYLRVIEVIRTASGLGYKVGIGQELNTVLLESANVDFLTAKQQSQLIVLVTGSNDKDSIISHFLRSEKLKPSARLQLDQVVTQMMGAYEQIQNRHRVRKSVEENIVKHMLRRYLEMIMDDMELLSKYFKSENVSYVSKVFSMKKGVKYSCGNCSEISETERDFVTLMIHENVVDDGNRLIVFPSGKVCPSCGNLNILTVNDHLMISRGLNRKYEALLRSWFAKPTEKPSKSTNVITYIPSSLSSVHPVLYEDLVGIDDSDSEENNKDFSIVHQWYKETLNVLSMMPTPEYKVESAVVIEDGRMKVRYDDMFNELDAVAKVFCSMFNENYRSLKASSLTTILTYLKENPVLLNSISVNLEYSNEILLQYKNYLESDLGESFQEVYTNLLQQLGIEADEYKVDGVLDVDRKEEMDNEILSKLDEIESDLERVRQQRTKALGSLASTIPLMRYMDIRFISLDDMEEVKGALVNKQVVEWVNRLSVAMILNRLSDRILDYWKTLKVGDVSNSSIFNPRSRKTLRELLDNLLKRTVKEYRGIKSSPLNSINEFLSREFFNVSDLDAIHELKTSVETLDVYGFYSAVSKLEGKMQFPSSSFSEIKELLAKHLTKAREFMENREDTLEEWYLFNFSSQFEEVEILEGIEGIKDRIKKPFVLKRKEGESFRDYLERLKDSKYDVTTCDTDPDATFFREIYGYVPSIYSVFELYSYISRDKYSHKYKLLINDLVTYSYLFGKKYMYEFLGILPSPKVLEIQGKSVSPEKEEVYKSEFFISNLIYPSQELNSLSSGGGEVEDEEYRNLLDYARSKPDDLLEHMRYFEELRGFVNEHYFSGDN